MPEPAPQPKSDLPESDLPEVDLPEIDLPEGAVAGRVLRVKPGGRMILEGVWQGRAAVFRIAASGSPEAAETLAREWREACRIWPCMQGVRFRTAEPLACLPERGLMVMARVAGVPLLDQVRGLPPEQAGARLGDAAAWLRRYTDVSESWRAARPDGWRARAERAAATQGHARLRGIETGIAACLRRLAGRLDGAEWRVAICHGDFHANNLLSDGAGLTGIDTGGSARMPVLRDVARFLMHMARRGVCPSGQCWCGIDAGMRDAFFEAFAMGETERRLVLPFFLGVEALIRVETAALPARRIRIAERVYGALRDDLEAIARA